MAQWIWANNGWIPPKNIKQYQKMGRLAWKDESIDQENYIELSHRILTLIDEECNMIEDFAKAILNSQIRTAGPFCIKNDVDLTKNDRIHGHSQMGQHRLRMGKMTTKNGCVLSDNMRCYLQKEELMSWCASNGCPWGSLGVWAPCCSNKPKVALKCHYLWTPSI